MVCFASVAPLLALGPADVPADAVLDDPLALGFLEKIRDAVGPDIEDPGHGVHLEQAGRAPAGPP